MFSFAAPPEPLCALHASCKDGQASHESDRLNILAAIGTNTNRLDRVVHGVVAASALGRVLRGGKLGQQKEKYLEVVCQR